MSLDLSDFENRSAKSGYGSNINNWNESRHRPDRYQLVDRPFIAWDGEGITYEDSNKQRYVLLAASTGDYITNPEGLTTEDCLGLLFRVEEKNRNAYHIGFGFSYDANQILNSFTRRELSKFNDRVNIGRTSTWRENVRFKHYPGKSFQVTRGGKFGEPDFINVRIDDTLSFFQRPFLEVVKMVCPERLKEIEYGKRNRSSFNYRDIDEIIEYCLAENQILVSVLDRLRDNLRSNGLHLSKWHGPGAIANSSMRLHKIKGHLGNCPREIEDISRYAYQGGRFELLRAGYSESGVWVYDINSAYPSAITTLPSFKEGYWEFTRTFEKGVFGVWHIRYSDNGTRQTKGPHHHFRARPLFFRNNRGGVGYPVRTEGWYWQPEAELSETEEENFEIIEGYIWRSKKEIYPFAWVGDRYNQRLEMKRNGDLDGERAIKLELNSLYGKMAQRAGWFQFGDKIPAFHNLIWAGYITSLTRSRLYRAYLQQPEAIISFETDAIFSLFPLNLSISPALGSWSESYYNNILYIQSGFYYLNGKRTEKESEIAHYRGFDRNESLSFDRMMDWVDKLDPFNPFKQTERLFGTTTRFVGYKRALKQKEASWRSWVTEEREITFARHGKRTHNAFPFCPQCMRHSKFSEEMHFLEIDHRVYGTKKLGEPIDIRSRPHTIPWLNCEDNEWAEQKEMESTDG